MDYSERKIRCYALDRDNTFRSWRPFNLLIHILFISEWCDVITKNSKNWIYYLVFTNKKNIIILYILVINWIDYYFNNNINYYLYYLSQNKWDNERTTSGHPALVEFIQPSYAHVVKNIIGNCCIVNNVKNNHAFFLVIWLLGFDWENILIS